MMQPSDAEIAGRSLQGGVLESDPWALEFNFAKPSTVNPNLLPIGKADTSLAWKGSLIRIVRIIHSASWQARSQTSLAEALSNLSILHSFAPREHEFPWCVSATVARLVFGNRE